MDSAQARTIEDLPERFNAAVDILDHNLEAGRADKVAVIDHRGSTTYGQLAERVARMAGAFRGLGVGREQRVLLCLLDTVDFPVAFLGALKAGVVPVPLNTLQTAADYEWILENSRAAAVFVSRDLADKWTDIAARHSAVKFVSSGGGPWTSLDDLIACAEPMNAPADTYRDEVAFWQYTSGSTGRPKGVMHPHSSMRLTANLWGVGTLGYRSSDVVLSVAKLFFAYGMGNALTFPYAVGATTVLLKDRPTPQAITSLVRTHGVTILNGVPTFFAGWFGSGEAPTREQAPHLRLATSAGEALPTHIGEAFKKRFGVDIIDGLGSTEMLHVFLAQRPGEVRYGCTGRPVPGYEVRIVNDAGQPAADDELGELQVRGPTMPLGYWANRPKSLSTFQGEWIRTGDKYRRDKDGWYTYGGRSDDMLKVGGIYVAPVEVEEVIASHEEVLEAAVIGVPDKDGLIKPRAHIVMKPGKAADAAVEERLRAHVKERLASYKCPRWFVFTDALPKTATGKIQRFRLREQG